MKRFLNYIFLFAAILISAFFVIESRNDEAAPPAQGQGMNASAAPAPEVRVQQVVSKKVSDTKNYIGRVEAINSVDLVARVSGYLESINFVEGSYVKAGDLMFTIEKQRFEAQIQSCKGTVAQTEAHIVDAEKYLRRLQSAKAESVPGKDIEAAQRDVDSYKAQLVSANAALKLAEIDLEYTTVRAPMSGRVTKKSYSVGDYVGPNSGTIVSIVQFDPIRVVCSMSEVEYVDLMQKAGSSPQDIFRPSLRLSNGSVYAEKGAWDFAASKIDTSTGTISLRSRYSNPKGFLIPGEYVTAVLSSVKGETMPLVPQTAVSEGQDGSYVYVVGDNNIAEKRLVKKGSVLGTDWIIEQGLQGGETVIVEGIQKVRENQPVVIQNKEAESASSTKGAS